MNASAPLPPVHGRDVRGCDRIALVLQGGGALGAYQAGVYEALHEQGIEASWFSGVSIGAVNAALIAGNPPERRLARLREFWDRITDSRVWPYSPYDDAFRQARNAMSSWLTMTFGQPGFFSPWIVNPWLSPEGVAEATSFYDNAPLRKTLKELIDFRLINQPDKVRLSVGAVDVESGNYRFFNNDPDMKDHVEITVDHVMASGALPPALPMVGVAGGHYWDGGLVSNTPLQFLLDQDKQLDTLVFQVDLFSARGALPRDMAGVLERQKAIVYSSRTRANTTSYEKKILLQRELYAALSRIPDDALTDDERVRRDGLARLPAIAIIQLIYQLKPYEGEAKDYEFSRSSMLDHWRSGYNDAVESLNRSGWLDLPRKGEAIVTRDIYRNEA